MANTKALYSDLVQNIEQMIKVYRHLLDVMRREKQILIDADLNQLNENNQNKEKVLIKLRGLDARRLQLVSEIASSVEIKKEDPKLLDLAIHFGGDQGDKLRNLHSVLVLLLKRIQEYNVQNEQLIKSALDNVTGTLKNLKNTLIEKNTYEKKGKLKEQKNPEAQFVSKEA